MLHYTTYLHPTATQWITFVHGAGGSSTIWFQQIRDFKKHYNLLFLDLRGHGHSKFEKIEDVTTQYTFDLVTEDIVKVLDKEGIQQSHFIGISLGTILIRNLAKTYPHRISSMIQGGAILKLDIRSQILIKLGVLFKSIIPYLWLYRFFAFIIMPNKNHRESRKMFVHEAKKLHQKEFIRWFQLTAEINPLLKQFRTIDPKIPTLYVMGQEDYLFLPAIKKIVAQYQSSELLIINNCGHVVNIEQATVFNKEVLGYLTKITDKEDSHAIRLIT